jgi:cytochrome c biogenesis factor
VLPLLPRAAAAASGHSWSLLLLLLLLPACCARLALAFMSARFSRRRFSTYTTLYNIAEIHKSNA